MIELNLLPQELKKKRRKIELPEIPIIPIAVGLVSTLITIQLLLSGLIFLSRKQLSGFEKKWEALAPKKGELDKIKEKIASTSKKTQAIESLVEKRFIWSRLLNELSNSLTANIWLTDLLYNEIIEKSKVEAEPVQSKKGRRSRKITEAKSRKIRTLTLSGSAAGKSEEATAYVARFIRSLKDNENFFKDFEDIELVSIKKGQVAGRDVMNFTLVCKFKPEEAES